MMQGDLRGSDPANGLAANADMVYDPTTGNANGSGRAAIWANNNPLDAAHYNALCDRPMCANVIPTSRISPVARKLMGLLQKAPGRFLPSASSSAPSYQLSCGHGFCLQPHDHRRKDRLEREPISSRCSATSDT